MQNFMSGRVAVSGCGNIQLGDDGFGPAAIAGLGQGERLPAHVHTGDVGTGLRDGVAKSPIYCVVAGTANARRTPCAPPLGRHRYALYIELLC